MSALKVLKLMVLTAILTVLPLTACVAWQSAEAPAAQVEGTAGGQVAAKAEQTAPTSVTVSLDELKELLDRKETPRVELTTTYSKLTGVALKIEKRTISVDVTGEQLAVAGVMGLPLSRIRVIKVLVPMTERERRAADEATRAYLAGITAAAAGAPGAAPTGAGDAAVTGEEETVDLLALYPPQDGWGPEKVAEITHKRVVLHLQAFGKEETFLRDYDAWVKAYNEKRDAQLEVQAAHEKAGTPLPQDFEILPELAPVPSLEGEPWGANQGVPPSDNHVEPLPEEQWK